MYHHLVLHISFVEKFRCFLLNSSISFFDFHNLHTIEKENFGHSYVLAQLHSSEDEAVLVQQANVCTRSMEGCCYPVRKRLAIHVTVLTKAPQYVRFVSCLHYDLRAACIERHIYDHNTITFLYIRRDYHEKQRLMCNS